VRFKTERGDYFLKWNMKPESGTFGQEAFQLSLLRETQTVRVPEVIGFAECEGETPGWMLQRWAGRMNLANRPERVGRRLAERLAALHAQTAGKSPGYGYVGRGGDGERVLPTQDWPTFLYEGQLQHSIERARRENWWTAERNRRVDQLIERLPELLGGVERAPMLLHGDLHSGNIRLSAEREPVLVDPWLFYGDREIEIVATQLSGDFAAEFYETYEALLPLAAGFEARAEIYRLVWYLGILYVNGGTAENQTANAIADPILRRYTEI